jgi:hypothetical protein
VMDLKSELPTDICMDDVDDNDCLYLYERDDDDIMGFLDIPDNLSDEIDQEE